MAVQSCQHALHASLHQSLAKVRNVKYGETKLNASPAPALLQSWLQRSSRKGAPWRNSPRRRVLTLLPVLAAMNEGSSSAASADEPRSIELAHKDLLVVGPGVLGTMVAQQWFQAHPDARVVGQTNTTNAHERLKQLGVVPVTRDNAAASNEKYPYVIFCAPPSGSADYVAEVRAAAARWNGQGNLLFTSSSGVYDVDDGGLCDEGAPVAKRGATPRLDKLLACEDEVLQAGGCVVRLAGLYTLERGAHKFWLQKGTVDSHPDYYLNLIHYEDAASLCVAALQSSFRKTVFMGCDNHPVTRKEVMDLTVRSGKFQGEFRGFTGMEESRGKKMHNDLTRAKLDWQPKYHSFAGFLGLS